MDFVYQLMHTEKKFPASVESLNVKPMTTAGQKGAKVIENDPKIQPTKGSLRLI